ncbi:MAG: histidine phosphatase family protein [Candidatus Altiarchaeota archaeon]|nr:histidine phosphatase family protein [Candidatus Altiarchaeota archaeon]
MKLILVRHGETIGNLNKIYQGQSDTALTENGLLQAKKLGLRFKDTKFDVVYSSDLTRAKNTAREILKHHSHLTLNLDKRLRERYFGSMEGKPWPGEGGWKNLPKDVETPESMRDRIKDFIDDIYLKHKDKTVLVVFHGAMKMVTLTVIHNQPVSDMSKWRGIKNTSVSEFDIKEDGNHKIHLINCTNHLD